MLRIFGNAFRAISVVALVLLAVAAGPTVGRAFAHLRPSPNEATLNQQVAEQSCAAFETWFLDPTCSRGHAKKVARTKRHLANK
jgi:hypothetical protein